SSRGERLLDTIKSRTLPLRFAPLPDDVVRGILRARGVPEERHDLAVELAAGSASTALELCDAELTAARDEFVARALAAVRAREAGPDAPSAHGWRETDVRSGQASSARRMPLNCQRAPGGKKFR